MYHKRKIIVSQQIKFDQFWLENSKVSKIYTLIGCFWPNFIMFELKKYRGVMFDCTQDWHQVWRKTGLLFQKLTWGIWQVLTRALEVTLIAYFCLRLKMYELKIYRRVICYNNVYSVRPPQTFQVQAEISTVRSVFPDCLSVSYDYCYKFITVQGK